MRLWYAAATLVAALTVVTPAGASFPGENGRIVFESNRHGGPSELFSMNPDATDIRRLTWNAVVDRLARFSPDGSRIVFTRAVTGNDHDIWIMDADGSDERRLTSGPTRDEAPVFTRDGEQVVFQRVAAPQVCPCELRIVGADGDGERLLDTGPGNAANPDVSKNGKLAFAGDRDGTLSIYVGDLRGGPVRRVTDGPAAFGDFRPRWSPRGNDLVFMRNDGGNLQSLDIYAVHASGTGLRRLTHNPLVEEHPQWSPDGERIVFSVLDAGPPFGGRLHTIDADDGSDEHVLPQAAEVADSFDHDGLDGSKWWESFHGGGSSLVVTGGRAETSLAADATNGPSGFMGPGFGSQCRAVGDYDARVRYELLDWPFSNGVHVLLGDAGTTGAIGRRSESGFDDYLAFFNPVPASALTDHMTGELRLMRSGMSLTALYREGDTWVSLLTGPTTTAPVLLNVHLFSNEAIFGKRFVRVAYDDFQIEATAFECPSWWRDAAPDWAVG